ncbi:MAG: hypothetical protein AAF598_13710, partial [Bacteroidota bacterium]
MPTVIDPEDFQELSLARYERLLNKDLIKLSKSLSKVEFFAFDEYQPLKKKAFILFADHDDEDWSGMITHIQNNARKQAQGVAEVFVDDEIYVIEIQKAEGNFSKANIKKKLNAELFDDDPDIYVIEKGEVLEDVIQTDNQLGTEDIDYSKEEEEYLVDTFKEYLAEALKLQEELESKIRTINTDLRGDPNSYNYQATAMALFQLYEEQEDALSDLIQIGRDWKEKYGELNHITPSAKDRQTKLKKSFDKNIRAAKRMLRSVLKAQDEIDTTYLIPKEVVKFKAKIGDLQSLI